MIQMFNKDGQPTKRSFRVYCSHNRCKEYIVGRWGGGYGCIQTKEGMFDSRNQVWNCDKHSKVKDEGWWSAKYFEKHTSKETKEKESDLCICGHRKYMHNHSIYLGVTFCKVHGCRHDNNPCKRFRKVK